MARHRRRVFTNTWPFDEEPDGSKDSRDYEFSGRLTAGRAAIIQAYCDKYTWRSSCGCPGDCCGCVYQQTTIWTYTAGQVVIRKVRYYNL
jgi:hypothetical protein